MNQSDPNTRDKPDTTLAFQPEIDMAIFEVHKYLIWTQIALEYSVFEMPTTTD